MAVLGAGIPASIAGAQAGPTAVRIGPVTAVAWAGELRLAEALAREAARTTTWPGIAAAAPESLRIIVVADGRRLAELSGGRAPAWSAGIALPDVRTVLVRADVDEPVRTLRHELAHLALHRAIASRVPLWFDEGYASWAAGELDRVEALELNLAVVRGAVPDLEQLDGALRGSEVGAGVAYGLAATAVLELARRNPESSLAPLLGRLARGENFAAAVRATTGLNEGQFELAWQRSLRRRYGVVTWLLAGGLWLVVALTVLIAAQWRRRVDRPRRAALDVGWEVPPDETPEETTPSELDPARRPE